MKNPQQLWMPDLSLHKTLSRVSDGQERDSLASPPSCWSTDYWSTLEKAASGSSVTYSVVRVSKSWSHRCLWSSSVGHQTKQTKRQEHENGARRDEGCVCDGVREVKDDGDGVPTMHHTDTWSYQATNLMNLKVGLGLKARCDCIQNIRLSFSRCWTAFPWHLPACNADSGKWPSFTATVAGKSIFSF